MRFLIFFMLLPIMTFSAENDFVVLLEAEGTIEIREPYQEQWTAVSVGTILKEKTTIKSSSNSSARLRSYDGRIFTLPAKAQIEARDLRIMDRNEVVSQLTALEMQSLPFQKKELKRPQAYILHGSVNPKSGEDKKQLAQFIIHEKNGALALFEQNFIAGFILKWNRFIYTCPGKTIRKLDQALIESYKKMNMPVRMNKMLQESTVFMGSGKIVTGS